MKAVTFTLLFFAFSTALFASQAKKTLTLRLQSPSGNSSEATLYFDEGITAGYNIHQDAAMVFSNIPGIPEIYSYTVDKVPCAINGCGTLQTSENIALGYQVGYPGNYTITAAVVSNFDPTTIIRLQDTKLGITIDLRENFYQVQLDSSDISTNRFYILVSSSVKYASTPANCANTGGSITITPDSSVTWNICQLIDSANQVLQTYNNLTGTVTFTGLPAGSYEVVYTYNQYTAVNKFFLNGNYVTASVGVPALQIYTYEDVVFDALTTNANHFNWDFGDSTLIIGVAHPTQRYFLPGTYVVNLSASNDVGCSATALATVVVIDGNPAGINGPNKSEATVNTNGKVVTVNMNAAVLSENAQLLIYNLLGQTVKALPLAAQISNISLENQANGYYFISIQNAGSINTKRVFIAK